MLALLAPVLLALLPGSTPQRMRGPSQPETFTSPSGEWSVDVDPVRWDGDGDGEYSVQHQGEEVWSAQLPFTLVEAVVDDQGYLAGYAIVTPEDGPEILGQFVVALVSPSGEVLAQHSTKRVANHYSSHSIPDPKAGGILLDQGQQRFVVRLSDPAEGWSWEEWVAYDLRSGERLEAFVPSELAGRSKGDDDLPWILAAKVVEGTPVYVTLGVNYRHDRDPREHDLVIELFDTHGEPVAVRTHEWEVEGSRGLRDEVGAQGLLEGSAPGDFSVWLPKSGKRVDYRVFRLPNDEGWDLRELGRSEYEPASPELVLPPQAEDLELRLIADVPLRSPAAQAALFRRVSDFSFDEVGHLMVLDRGEGFTNKATCLLLTAEGEVLLERAFEFPFVSAEAHYSWWPFEDGRWLVFVETWEDDSPHNGQAWWADPATGELSELEDWPASIADGFSIFAPSLASTHDGGFLVGGNHSLKWTFVQKLGSFDEQGRTRWMRGEFGSGAPNVLSIGSGNMLVTPEGLIVTLDRAGLMVFGPAGEWRDGIALKALWGLEHLHTTGLMADPLGALIVVSSAENATVRRIDMSGAILEEFTPRRADGSADDSMARRIRVAPDGRIWASDGYLVMRLGSDGIADLTLGAAPEEDALNEAATPFIDRWQGRIVVQDTRTWALHVFGADGERQFVARPDPEDYAEESSMFGGSRLAAARNGRLFSELIAYPDEAWIAYGPTGEREGQTKLGGRGIVFARGAQRWRPGKEAQLLAEDGEVLATITRHANGDWLTFPDDLDVASDGSVAIIDRSSPSMLSLYAADGTPQSDHPLPEGAGSVYYLQREGRWVVCWGWNSALWLLRIEDGTWFRVPAPWPVDGDARIEVDFSLDGTELWVVDGRATRLHRYALPTG